MHFFDKNNVCVNGKEATVNKALNGSCVKASTFCIWQYKLCWFKTQQLILGTGTAIWWVT